MKSIVSSYPSSLLATRTTFTDEHQEEKRREEKRREERREKRREEKRREEKRDKRRIGRVREEGHTLVVLRSDIFGRLGLAGSISLSSSESSSQSHMNRVQCILAYSHKPIGAELVRRVRECAALRHTLLQHNYTQASISLLRYSAYFHPSHNQLSPSTQNHTAPRSTKQHHAAPRSTTQHHAAPRSTTQNSAASHDTTQYYISLYLNTISSFIN